MNCTQNSACRPRHLVLVLGDQLNRGAAAFDDFDADRDAVWMAEVEEEITHVWCHRLRIAFFCPRCDIFAMNSSPTASRFITRR